jgi:hypothetical protein
MKNSPLVMFAIVAVVAMLTTALVILPTQEVDARTSIKIIQKQENKCRQAGCSIQGTINFGFLPVPRPQPPLTDGSGTVGAAR